MDNNWSPIEISKTDYTDYDFHYPKQWTYLFYHISFRKSVTVSSCGAV